MTFQIKHYLCAREEPSYDSSKPSIITHYNVDVMLVSTKAAASITNSNADS